MMTQAVIYSSLELTVSCTVHIMYQQPCSGFSSPCICCACGHVSLHIHNFLIRLTKIKYHFLFFHRELSRFIAAGRLHCKIDKVNEIVETNR